MALTFWFEFASTYSYPAALRIAPLAAQAGVRVAWRPFLLGPLFAAQGWNDSPFNLYPAKGRYMWRDLARICAAAGLPFQRPAIFPQNSLLAARIAFAAQDTPWIGEFACAVYRANFAEGRDISQTETLAAALAAAGAAPAPWLARASDPELKAQFRRQNEETGALGLFGAPSFTVGEELFWGNDRLEAALAWAARHGSHPAPA